MTSIELCAGAGGQALGLEQAGFEHTALVENDRHACSTLRLNRPDWQVIEADLRNVQADRFPYSDLVAAGVPCPPFSRAGAQLGSADERDMFPHALRIISAVKPRAVLFENVRGFLDANFSGYRLRLRADVERFGLKLEWRLLYASDFGVPQLRPRAVGVGLREEDWPHFHWPVRTCTAPTVGDALYGEMVVNGWLGADSWRDGAQSIAPTLVGGSKKHGGADLGPTRAKKAWRALGVDALVLANSPPEKEYRGLPRLTVPMTALLQGFPAEWKFAGGKTAAYRQVGNAFPPPVAKAVGLAIHKALVRPDFVGGDSSPLETGAELTLNLTIRG